MGRKEKMNCEVDTKDKQSGNETAVSRRKPVVLHIGPEGVVSPFVTHWSRIFYYDLFTGDTGSGAPVAPETDRRDSYRPVPDDAAPDLHRENKETFVPRKDPDHDNWIPRFRTPIEAAVILLGIYATIYLTVAGIVHVLGSPDATAAVAPDTSIARH